MSTRRLTSWAVAVFAILSASRAFADDAEESKTLFNAGAQAYERGDFQSAILAFEQAYRVKARPGLLFSIAQAHRRQYVLDKKAAHVMTAVLRLKEYLAQVPSGERRADAVALLAELEPVVQELERKGELTAIAPPKVDEPARVMISSPAKGAKISIDGKPPLEAPISLEVSPGEHNIDVTAEGYYSDHRKLTAAPKGVTALDIPLRELPASVTIRAVDGASVMVDGRAAGVLPLAGPLAVPPGYRRLVVTMPGRITYVEDVVLVRGKPHTVDAEMKASSQRKIAYSLFAVAGVGAIGTAACAITSVLAQDEARQIHNRMLAGEVICKGAECPELSSYDAALSRRDLFRAVTTAAGTAAGLSLLAGVSLFVFETPLLPPGGPPASLNAPARERTPSLEVSLGAGSLAVSGQF